MKQLLKRVILFLFFLSVVFLPLIGSKVPPLSPSKAKSLRAIYSTGKIKLEQVVKISLDTLPDNVAAKMLFRLVQFKDRLYITDIDTHDIKILNTKGIFIRTAGRIGSGPGDTYFPASAFVSLNRLVVYEIGNDRLSYFDTNGKFLKNVRFQKKGSIKNIDCLDDGRIVVESVHVIGSEEKKEIHEVRELRLFSSEMKYIKKLYSQEEHLFKYMMDNGEPARQIQPLRPFLLWTKLPGNKIVVGFPEKYEFKIINVDTGMVKTISRLYTREKVSAADKEDYFKYREIQSKSDPEKMKYYKDNISFLEYRPAYSSIKADSEGNILVLFYRIGPKGNIMYGAGQYFDAFDSEGNFLGHVKVMNASGFSPVFGVDGNHFWCHQQNEESEEFEWIKYKVSAD